MAHGAKTITAVDETPRPFFGLSLFEALACIGAYILAQRLYPHLHGIGTFLLFVPPLALGALFVATHKVRVEPYLAQLNGFLLRKLAGQGVVKPRAHRVIEVDGFTRAALTEDEQDTQVIWRLQQQLAALGAGGDMELLAVKRSQDSAAIVSRIRAVSHPTTPVLAALVERRCRRLAPEEVGTGGQGARHSGTARGSVINYYVVVYEPAAWRGRSVVRLLRRLPLVRDRMPVEMEDTSLDDIVHTVREALVKMGLRPTLVEAAARAGGVPVRESLTHALCNDGRYASACFMLMAPAETDPGFADPLINSEGPYHLALWVHGTDPDRMAARIGTQQRQNVAMAVQAVLGGGRVGAVQAARVEESDRALLDLRKPGQGVAPLGVYYAAYAATPWEAERKRRRALLTIKRAMAARPGRGLFHQGPLVRSAHVGADTAHSCYHVHVETAANAYPFNRDNPSMEGGYRVGTTERDEEVLFDPTDESLRNALVVILGLSGQGKTHLVMRLLREHLERAGRATVLGAIPAQYAPLMATVGGVVVRSAAELDAVPIDTQMVFVDIEGMEHVGKDLMRAVDRRVKTRVGTLQHALVLEEAWQLAHKDAALWVNELARFARSWGGYVEWVSHDPEDLLSNPHIVAMFKNAATKIAFALSDRKGVASAIGAALELTDAQVRTVKQLARGECYIMRHNVLRGSVVQGVCRVGAEPEERWMFLTDPRLPQWDVRAAYIAKHGADVMAAIFDLADNVPYDDDDARRIAGEKAAAAAHARRDESDAGDTATGVVRDRAPMQEEIEMVVGI